MDGLVKFEHFNSDKPQIVVVFIHSPDVAFTTLYAEMFQQLWALEIWCMFLKQLEPMQVTFVSLVIVNNFCNLMFFAWDWQNDLSF